MKTKILITGGTGFVGKNLCKLLLSQGYEVAILSRRPKKNTENISYFKWDVSSGFIDKACLNGVSCIIHLAGENVASSRWTSKRKKQILTSRTKSTQLLEQLLAENKQEVETFISASAIGFYGTTTSEKIYNEEDAPGNDFLADVCKQWESSVDKIEKLAIRTVKFRVGVVFGKKGSALQKMLLPINLGIGSAIGTGKQYMPWIHIEDLCNMYLLAINKPKLCGVYNAVVGEELTNYTLSKLIAEELKKPFFMPKIPSFVFQLIFGELSVILLKGSRVSSEKITKAGFVFKYPTIEKALKNLLAPKLEFKD
ncbi:TIGR01777 family oxidoreductase [Flavicella sediminum]|uniref:TIGR01777 family oxidoreductase n=1 Tax=Flavicella sediminum TaxID=2585141 RepID=UPI00111EF61D|nr:TIGR01777 family oxidoreductase [Flavicella sediminum]